MGGPNSDRIYRVRHLRVVSPGSIRVATCRACGHQGALPVDRLVKLCGELMPVALALSRLACSQCGKRDVGEALVKLCEPGCRRQRN